MNDNEFKNSEGYSDPTAGVAFKHIDQEYERFRLLVDTLHKITKLAGFHIEEKVVLKDRRTGRIWR